jgi:preprotein translocase subunit SecG
MTTFIIVLHVIVAIALILTVLLQTGKGASMGAAFGGGSSSTVFGSRGPASFMSKLTAAAAIIFMITSLSLSFFSERRIGDDSVMDQMTPPAQEETTVPEASEPAASTPVTSEPAEPAEEPEAPKETATPIGEEPQN